MRSQDFISLKVVGLNPKTTTGTRFGNAKIRKQKMKLISLQIRKESIFVLYSWIT